MSISYPLLTDFHNDLVALTEHFQGIFSAEDVTMGLISPRQVLTLLRFPSLSVSDGLHDKPIAN